jgi:hypothetical protein
MACLCTVALKQKLHPEGHLNKTAVVGAEIQTEDP